LADAALEAREYTRKAGAYLVDDATDPDLPAGPAAIACEILEEVPDVGSIWVPVGDTALIRGVAFAAKHLQPAIRIVGIQASQAPAYYLSWKEGRAIPTDSCKTIADGLATRTPVMANVQEIQQLVDEMVLVSEDQMVDAIGHLLLRERIVAEPAGAAAAAAFIHGHEHSRGSSVLLVTGSNVSVEVLRAALDRGGLDNA
jgi:threonine dehydratase